MCDCTRDVVLRKRADRWAPAQRNDRQETGWVKRCWCFPLNPLCDARTQFDHIIAVAIFIRFNPKTLHDIIFAACRPRSGRQLNRTANVYYTDCSANSLCRARARMCDATESRHAPSEFRVHLPAHSTMDINGHARQVLYWKARFVCTSIYSVSVVVVSRLIFWARYVICITTHWCCRRRQHHSFGCAVNNKIHCKFRCSASTRPGHDAVAWSSRQANIVYYHSVSVRVRVRAVNGERV